MINGKKVLCLIPARGGSKRLPEKNTLLLSNKPLIAWSIETALKSKYIDKIIVSTDSHKIANISREYGAVVPFIRPDELATDVSTSFDVIKHSIHFLKKKNEIYDYIILLQPTSPLRVLRDIECAFESMDKNSKCIVSVCKTEHPPLWSNTLPEDLSMKDFLSPEINNKRSQDLPVYYRLNGAVYISEIDYMMKNSGFFGNQTKAYIMPQERSVDIDSKIDFELCNIILNSEV